MIVLDISSAPAEPVKVSLCIHDTHLVAMAASGTHHA